MANNRTLTKWVFFNDKRLEKQNFLQVRRIWNIYQHDIWGTLGELTGGLISEPEVGVGCAAKSWKG